jgi:hypothetical protein
MTESNNDRHQIHWECDSCAYREWRPASEEPFPCVICGYERWHPVKDGSARDDVPGGYAPSD